MIRSAHFVAILALAVAATPVLAGDGTAIPHAFIGVWGAASAPCADVDATDRVTISSDSLRYYEMTDTVTHVDIRDARHIVVDVEATDDGDDKGEMTRRDLRLSRDGDGLTLSGFPNNYVSKLARCRG